MYLGVCSPVVGLFLSADVPRDVRLLAARGLVMAEGRDRLVLLALLTTDADVEVAVVRRRDDCGHSDQRVATVPRA